MKSKIAALGLISLILVGCGSNNNLSTAPVADTGNTSNVSIPSGSTGYPAPFGTAIYTPFFPSGQSTLDNTFMFTETETVVEGDVVVVKAYGSFETTNSNQEPIDSINVALNGVSIGIATSSLYGVYSASAAGSVTLSATWSGLPANSTAVSFNGGNVFTVHCVDSSGNAITCPTDFTY